TFAFARRDAGGGAAEACVVAITHFHEYQCITIAHDQIQFAEAGAEVACDRFQACFAQMTAGTLFEVVTDAAHQPPVCVAEEPVGAGGAAGEAGSAVVAGVAGCAVGTGVIGAPMSRLPASGCATPLLKLAQVMVRWIWPKSSSDNR